MAEFKEESQSEEDTKSKKTPSPVARRLRQIVLGLGLAASAMRPGQAEANPASIESHDLDAMFSDLYSPEERQEIKEYIKENIIMARKLVNDELPDHKGKDYWIALNRDVRNWAQKHVQDMAKLSSELSDKKTKFEVPKDWDAGKEQEKTMNELVGNSRLESGHPTTSK